MSDNRIHPVYCRCPQCVPHHPSADEIAPSLKAALLALAAMGALGLVLWLGLIVAHQLTAIVP